MSASKPTGGLPETAREQLNAHMELYSQFKAKEDVYSQLLAKGRLMLLNRDDSGSASKTEQSVALLEQKWGLVSTKMEERKVTLRGKMHPALPQGLLCFPTLLSLTKMGIGFGFFLSVSLGCEG